MKVRRSAVVGVPLSVLTCVLVACGSDPAFVEQQSFQQGSKAGVAKGGLDATVDTGGEVDAGNAETDPLAGRGGLQEISKDAKDADNPAQTAELGDDRQGALEGANDSPTLEAPPSGDPTAAQGGGQTAGASSGQGSGQSSGDASGQPPSGDDDDVADSSDRGGVKEDVKAPPANSVPMNVVFSQLRGDAWFTNCLGVRMNSGAAVAMGCNKDGDLRKDVSVSASPAPFCNMISLNFTSQGKTLVDSQTRFNMERIRIKKLSSTTLEIGLEDNTDGDFNDYIVRIEVPSTLKYFIQGTDVTNCE